MIKKALFVVFKWNVIIVDVKKNIANICHHRKIINIIITFSASYWKQKNNYSPVYEQLIESFHTLRVLVRPLSSIKSREVGALLMNCFSSSPICPDSHGDALRLSADSTGLTWSYERKVQWSHGIRKYFTNWWLGECRWSINAQILYLFKTLLSFLFFVFCQSMTDVLQWVGPEQYV